MPPARSPLALALTFLGAAGLVTLTACSESLAIPSTGSSAAVTAEATDPTAPADSAPVPTTSAPDDSSDPTDPTDATDATDATAPPGAPVGTIEWSELEDGVDEGLLAVPLDHGNPDGDQIELYLVRHRATDPSARIGVLFVNPGGPGYGASDLAAQADFIYDRPLLDAFDIIGIDPRGTGLSEPAVDCVDAYDPYFGVETGPDDAAEDAALREAAVEFTAGCVERSGDLLRHLTTVDAARDMDLVRQAVGEETVSYFGWSYGTQLGAAWATLFPDTVRAAVLDGAVDPTVGRIDGLVQQAAGFDASLSSFLADCSADVTCAFHNDGDAEGAFFDLLVRVETTRIPTTAGRPELTQGVFEVGVAQAMYSDAFWPQLATALATAAAGDGGGMLALYDAYFGRLPDGTYGDELEAYFAITCADDPAPDDAAAAIDEAVARRRDFSVAAPRISTKDSYEVLICASFPEGATGPGNDGFRITGAGAGPIVVVGNTGDPATPFEGSRRMAETLEDGVFVAVEADQHTAYGLNACIDDAIDGYLVSLVVPDDLTC
ncbi:MAG: alpha/beta hydrolase [Actinobacteria bacterium]|nr:alpha/beta hydrolase [Actinomycetota bacterium]